MWPFHKHDWRIERNPIIISSRSSWHPRGDEAGWFYSRDDDHEGRHSRRLVCAVCPRAKWEHRYIDRTDLPKA